MRATDLLHRDHEMVDGLFKRLRQGSGDDKSRQALLDQIADELEIHTKIEEELFYPALRKVSGLVDEAIEEHRQVSSLVGDAEGPDPSSAEFMNHVAQLEQAVKHHVAEEEGPIFQDARKLSDAELEALGARLAERKEHLKTSLLQRGVRAAKLAAKKAV